MLWQLTWHHHERWCQWCGMWLWGHWLATWITWRSLENKNWSDHICFYAGSVVKTISFFVILGTTPLKCFSKVNFYMSTRWSYQFLEIFKVFFFLFFFPYSINFWKMAAGISIIIRRKRLRHSSLSFRLSCCVSWLKLGMIALSWTDVALGTVLLLHVSECCQTPRIVYSCHIL